MTIDFMDPTEYRRIARARRIQSLRDHAYSMFVAFRNVGGYLCAAYYGLGPFGVGAFNRLEGMFIPLTMIGMFVAVSFVLLLFLAIWAKVRA